MIETRGDDRLAEFLGLWPFKTLYEDDKDDPFRPNAATTRDPLDRDLMPDTKGMAVRVHPVTTIRSRYPAQALPSMAGVFGMVTVTTLVVVALIIGASLFSATTVLCVFTALSTLRTLKLFFVENAPISRCFLVFLSGPLLWAFSQFLILATGTLSFQIAGIFIAVLLIAVCADAAGAHYAREMTSLADPPTQGITELRRLWRLRWLATPWSFVRLGKHYTAQGHAEWKKDRRKESRFRFLQAACVRELAWYQVAFLVYFATFLAAVFLAKRVVAPFFQPMFTVLGFAALLWIVALPWCGRPGLHSALRAGYAWMLPPNRPSTEESHAAKGRRGLAWLLVLLIVGLAYPCSAYFPLQPFLEPHRWAGTSQDALESLDTAASEYAATLELSPGVPFPRGFRARGLWMFYGFRETKPEDPTTFLDHCAPVISLASCVLVLSILVFPSFSLLIGRPLRNYELDPLKEFLFAEDEARPDVWDDIVERLLNSTYEAPTRNGTARERDHLYLGTNLASRSPVLLDRSILREHGWILGDSGTGKTARGIAPMVTQLIRANAKLRHGTADAACSLVIVDLKGDNALFHGAKIEAERADVLFRWFSSTHTNASYVFNPLQQSYIQSVNEEQFAGNLLQAMGLEYGFDYGRAHYSYVNRNVLAPVLKAFPKRITSMRALKKCILEVKSRRGGQLIEGFSRQDAEDARHLFGVIDSLCNFDALNAAPGDDYPWPVFENAIDMNQVLETPQVLYFCLPTLIGAASVKEIGRLALFSLLTAATNRKQRGLKRVQTFVFIDEFQQLVSDKIAIFLEQARHANIGVIMANQHRGQLKTPGADIVDTVETCAFKMTFGASGAAAKSALSMSSGEAFYHMRSEAQGSSYTANSSTTAAGEARSGYSIGSSMTRSTQETLGPRLRPNDIARVSDDPDLAIVEVSRGRGFSRYGGLPFIIETKFHISGKEYARRDDELPWPKHPHAVTPTTRSGPSEEPLGGILASAPNRAEEPTGNGQPVVASRAEPPPPAEAPRPVVTETSTAPPTSHAIDEWHMIHEENEAKVQEKLSRPAKKRPAASKKKPPSTGGEDATEPPPPAQGRKRSKRDRELRPDSE